MSKFSTIFIVVVILHVSQVHCRFIKTKEHTYKRNVGWFRNISVEDFSCKEDLGKKKPYVRLSTKREDDSRDYKPCPAPHLVLVGGVVPIDLSQTSIESSLQRLRGIVALIMYLQSARSTLPIPPTDQQSLTVGDSDSDSDDRMNVPGDWHAQGDGDTSTVGPAWNPPTGLNNGETTIVGGQWFPIAATKPTMTSHQSNIYTNDKYYDTSTVGIGLNPPTNLNYGETTTGGIHWFPTTPTEKKTATPMTSHQSNIYTNDKYYDTTIVGIGLNPPTNLNYGETTTVGIHRFPTDSTEKEAATATNIAKDETAIGDNWNAPTDLNYVETTIVGGQWIPTAPTEEAAMINVFEDESTTIGIAWNTPTGLIYRETTTVGRSQWFPRILQETDFNSIYKTW